MATQRDRVKPLLSGQRPTVDTIPRMLNDDLSRRAVVTGLGAITAIGNDHPTFWKNLVAGVSGAGPITSFDASSFDVRIAAEVKDFDPATVMDRKMARRMSRFVHFGMSAGKEAVRDSGLDFTDWSPERRDRVAVAVNTGGGGMEAVTDGTDILTNKGPGSVSPFALPALSASMAACQLSMEFGLTGPVITTESSDAHAGQASRRMRQQRGGAGPGTDRSGCLRPPKSC